MAVLIGVQRHPVTFPLAVALMADTTPPILAAMAPIITIQPVQIQARTTTAAWHVSLPRR